MTAQSILLQRKLVWTRSFVLNGPFPEIPPTFRFRFGSTAQNESPDSAERFNFLINSKKFIKVTYLRLY